MNRTSSKSTFPWARDWRLGDTGDRENRLGQLERNPALDPGGAVEHRSDERQHAVRDLVVDDGPFQPGLRAEPEPGRAVLHSHELGIGVQRAAVEPGIDRVDRQPCRPTARTHDRRLAEPHPEDVERVDLHADLAAQRAEPVDRPGRSGRSREPPRPRAAR